MTPDEARELLGVSAAASHAEVRAAYRRLAKELRPDLGRNAALFRLVVEAHSILTTERDATSDRDVRPSPTRPPRPSTSQAPPPPPQTGPCRGRRDPSGDSRRAAEAPLIRPSAYLTRTWEALVRCAQALPLPRTLYGVAVTLVGWLMTCAFVSALVRESVPSAAVAPVRGVALAIVIGLPLTLLAVRVLAAARTRRQRRERRPGVSE
ncbi:DnaJ domain-containing protein [Pseudonocardia sp. WMMC193]|uniref:J domain-containing protein n=1 Tax=Pseudonocardia sp. WMMC193 TaxID=2911965 RepID=UPI0035ABCA3C